MTRPFLVNKTFLFFVVLVCLTIIFVQVIPFVCNEQLIYYWDYKGYWMTWQNYAQLRENSTLAWLNELRRSVRRDDYNSISVALLFPFYFLPVDKRLAYILSVSLCYLTPTVLLLAAIFKRIEGFQSNLWLFCIAIMAATYAPFWGPLLRGFPDIVGLIPILGVVLFVLCTDIKEKIAIKNILILGVLLWLPFLLRRWYAYTVVSLYFTLPFFSFFIHTISEKKRFKQFFNIGIQFFLAGTISLLLVFIFQRDLLLRVMATNYSEIYSGYQSGFIFSLKYTTLGIGLYLFPFFVAGVVWSSVSKKSYGKYLGVFSILNLILSFLFFTMTQTPGIQHRLPFALWIFLSVILGFRWMLCALPSLFQRKLVLVLGTVLSMLVCVVTFHQFNALPAFLNSEYLPLKQYPLRIENFSNYQNLAADIEKRGAKGHSTTILASGHKFNDELMKTAAEERISPYLVAPSHVDLRDHLDLNIFLSDYIVVGSPAQTHMAKGHQQVIIIPTQELISGAGISAAYKRLPQEYELASGIKAIVFEKIRPLTYQESKDFLSKFVELYPDWDGPYLKPLALAYMSADIALGDGPWSQITYVQDGSISTHPGQTLPVRIDWDFGDIHRLTINSTNLCKEADGVIISLSNGAGAQRSVEVANGATVTIDVSEFTHQRGLITISMNTNDLCDSIKITAD